MQAEVLQITTKDMETTTIRRPASFRLRADLLEGLKRNAARTNLSLNNDVESVLLDVVYNEPNEETKEAIREAMNRKEYPAEDVYDNVDEMFKALGGFGSFYDNFSDPEKYYPEIDELYKWILDKREGIYPDAGEKTVVLGGMMGGMLAHEAVGHTVEADLVRGGSVAGPCLNKRVASELVNLVDFAHTYNGGLAPLPVYLDDEGIIAEDAVLIKDSILVGYMNDRESAAGYGMKPAGNARGWTFRDEPIIRMRNTCILPGKNTVEELIASVDDGYYLIQSGNGQADLTGEFMFGVICGYEIKNGKLGRALLDTTVSGIAFDMLKSVDMVSDEVEWSSSGFCGKKQPMAVGMGGPHIRCKITIGGR